MKERNLKQWSVKKSKKDMTELRARIQAMEKLNTFESNLSLHHSETHFVFRKIRG